MRTNTTGHGQVRVRLQAAITTVLVLAVLAAMPSAASAERNCGTWWVGESALEVGAALPEFGYVTCDGTEMTTRGLHGTPALINFWATWCGPCVKELPHFSAIHERYGADVQVLGVSVDESPADVRKFLKRKPLAYTLAWDSDGIAGGLGITAIPVTIALDAAGRVTAVHRGYASEADLLDMLATAQQQ